MSVLRFARPEKYILMKIIWQKQGILQYQDYIIYNYKDDKTKPPTMNIRFHDQEVFTMAKLLMEY